MRRLGKLNIVIAVFLVASGLAASQPASAQDKKPNIRISSWVTTLAGCSRASITAA